MIQVSTDPTRFHFGGYTLDVAAGLVLHEGRRIELRPQTFAVLEMLVRHKGELVTKDSLMQAVWGDRVVTEDSIVQCIREIRSALGEPGQRLLRTVPRRGYRLESRKTEQRQAPESPSAVTRPFKPARLAAGAAVFLALLTVLFLIGPQDQDREAQPDAQALEDGAERTTGAGRSTGKARGGDALPYLAVLPFAYRGDEKSSSYLADGLHDDLLTSLAQSPQLRVISRTSVMPYGASTQPLPEIAKELGVDYVLEGSVDVNPAGVRVIVQMIEADSDTHQWAGTFDRQSDPKDLFAMRSELSEAIAAAMQAQLDIKPVNGTHSPLALEAYYRGRQLLFRGGVERLEEALQQFVHAVEIDPEYADAWVGVADSQMALAGSGSLPQQESWPVREEAIERAIAINPEHAGAHAARGWLHWNRVAAGYLQESEAGGRAFRRAIELNPSDSRAHMGYALLLNHAYPERIRESINLLEQAARLDPSSETVAINLAATYRFLGLFDPAERALLDVLANNPNEASARFVLAHLYLDWGRLAAARAQVEAAVQHEPLSAANWALAGETALEMRDLERAHAVLDALRDLAPRHPAALVLDVKLLQRAGQHEAATARLEQALELYGPEPGLVNFGIFAHLLMQDMARAERWLDLLPTLEDEAAWPDFIRLNGGNACVLGWLAMQSGRPRLGERLVAESTRYLLEQLPASRDHVDRYKPDLCHLASGEPELALASIEQQAAHGHIALWDDWHRLPLYEAIRNEERYKAAVAQRERLLSAERRQAGLP